MIFDELVRVAEGTNGGSSLDCFGQEWNDRWFWKFFDSCGFSDGINDLIIEPKSNYNKNWEDESEVPEGNGGDNNNLHQTIKQPQLSSIHASNWLTQIIQIVTELVKHSTDWGHVIIQIDWRIHNSSNHFLVEFSVTLQREVKNWTYSASDGESGSQGEDKTETGEEPEFVLLIWLDGPVTDDVVGSEGEERVELHGEVGNE